MHLIFALPRKKSKPGLRTHSKKHSLCELCVFARKHRGSEHPALRFLRLCEKKGKVSLRETPPLREKIPIFAKKISKNGKGIQTQQQQRF